MLFHYKNETARDYSLEVMITPEILYRFWISELAKDSDEFSTGAKFHDYFVKMIEDLLKS